MRISPENLYNRLNRRDFLKLLAVAIGTVGAVYGAKEVGSRLEEQQELKDPYKEIWLDAYLEGYVSINLKGVNVRTAPTTGIDTLRISNPEGYIKGEIPPNFIVAKSAIGISQDRKAILGDLVEVNGVSVVWNIHDAQTGRKSKLIIPIVIQNPGIVKGQDPDNPRSQEGFWVVLKTTVRVPEESLTDYPKKEFYTTVNKTFFVNLGRQTTEFVKLVDEKGNPISDTPKLVPLVKYPDGTHAKVADNQPVRKLGRVIPPNELVK